MEREIGKLIGSGGTSNVYEWGDNQVIKIYKPHVSDDVINHESYIGELLNRFSLGIPKYIGSTMTEGKRALLYERIYGKNLAEPLINGYYNPEIAYQFAKMHYDIHKKAIHELPSQYDFLRNRIVELENLDGKEVTLLLNLLDSIPVEHKLCHGDYQPLNIVGESIIDWNGACSGSPLLDVAWSYMTLNSPIIMHLLGEEISNLFLTLANDYLSYYCQLAGLQEDQILRCLPIVAARRLFDNNQSDNDFSRQEKAWLFNLCSFEE
jgi:serine/threonine protein kinase